MPVVLLVAAAAILGGVVLAALGRVGEMATFAGDTAPLELDEVSATDVALLRPPMSLWGDNAQATEEALRVIARSVTARDVEIARFGDAPREEWRTGVEADPVAVLPVGDPGPEPPGSQSPAAPSPRGPRAEAPRARAHPP